MPADLESRLASARRTAAQPPPALIVALRQRRHSRRAATLGVVAASLAVALGMWVNWPAPSAAPLPRTFAAAPSVFIPTIRALSVANRAMDPENLRLPSLGPAAAAEPMTVRSFEEVGG